MDKFETGQCSRCQQLYSSDDSSSRSIPKSKVVKSKRPKLIRSDILSLKDKAKQALKVEIKSRIEKRQPELNLQVTENKRLPFSKKNFSKNFAVDKSFQNNFMQTYFEKSNSS